MIFSAIDIPILASDLESEIVEWLGKPGSTLSPTKVEPLTAKVDALVASTHAYLDRILLLDLNWRTSVFRGEAEYDPVIEEDIRSSLKFWIDLTELNLSRLDRFKSKGFAPASPESLRPRLAEVRAMLTPDVEFFKGDQLDELAAQALDEDDRGLTAEFRAMGE